MEQRGLTPIEAVECKEKDNDIEQEPKEVDNNIEQELQPNADEQQNSNPSPEPESGIGRDVDSDVDPNGDLGKGDDLDDLKKPKSDVIMDEQPSPNTSEDEAEPKQADDKPKPTSKPPKFDNSVEPIEYSVPVARRPAGRIGGHAGRGPRKAVAIIIVCSVIAVALVVGLVLAADVGDPKPTATLYGYMETDNIQFKPEYNKSTEEQAEMTKKFMTSMEMLFVNSSFESAYNSTEVMEFGKSSNNFLTIVFKLGLRYFFDNSTNDDNKVTPSTTMTTTDAGATTMELPTIDRDTPMWIAKIIYFVYEDTAKGNLGNFRGRIVSLSTTDPDDITTKQPTTMMTTLLKTTAP